MFHLGVFWLNKKKMNKTERVGRAQTKSIHFVISSAGVFGHNDLEIIDSYKGGVG